MSPGAISQPPHGRRGLFCKHICPRLGTATSDIMIVPRPRACANLSSLTASRRCRPRLPPAVRQEPQRHRHCARHVRVSPSRPDSDDERPPRYASNPCIALPGYGPILVPWPGLRTTCVTGHGRHLRPGVCTSLNTAWSPPPSVSSSPNTYFPSMGRWTDCVCRLASGETFHGLHNGDDEQTPRRPGGRAAFRKEIGTSSIGVAIG